MALSVPLLETHEVEWLSSTGKIGSRVLCLGVGTGFSGALWADGQAHAMGPGHEPLGFVEELGRVTTVEEACSGMAIEYFERNDLTSAPW